MREKSYTRNGITITLTKGLLRTASATDHNGIYVELHESKDNANDGIFVQLLAQFLQGLDENKA